MSVPLPVPNQPEAVAEKVNAQELAVQAQAKYAEERNKRVKDEGLNQYIDLIKSDKFKHYSEDPWIDRSIPGKRPPKDTCKTLILGAGYGALLFAARLVDAGFDPKDIFFVDSAGGFGGTWYWNRYPGLMCDVESYIYMPLLEETGYMPKHKYSYGPELREHAERIAAKWGLTDQLIPSATIKDSVWNEESGTYATRIILDRFDGEEFTITSNFLLLASGVLNTPKIPAIPGIDSFKGHIFHTARWDYNYCGGSPQSPSLSALSDKRVAIIGTGATAIQVVPELAKVCKSFHVFQRTPSAVDVRGQRPTDPETWSRIASKPGWQYDRMYNYSAYLSDLPDKPAENLVDDGWTHFPSYSALVGGPHCAGLTPETIGPHIAKMQAMDFPRQERVRARVDSIVEDKATAEALKPWYAGWCKRPCFHDEYLQSFNKPNVTLVDTKGRGVTRFTESGLVFDDREYDFDLVVMSTGFNSPAIGNPASKAGVSVTGRDGMTMDKKWEQGVGTLHGVVTRGLPNLFFPGPTQAGASANHVCTLNVITSHVAYILAEATKRANGGKVVVEPTEAGEMGWTYQVMPQAISYAILMGCTPSYLNREGEVDREVPMEEKMKGARAAGWSRGILDYERTIKEWESQGGLEGLEVEVRA